MTTTAKVALTTTESTATMTTTAKVALTTTESTSLSSSKGLLSTSIATATKSTTTTLSKSRHHVIIISVVITHTSKASIHSISIASSTPIVAHVRFSWLRIQE